MDDYKMSLRILVADDEDLSARLLVQMLKDEGFAHVDVVYSPQASVEYIEKNKPDLVFLDINFNVDMTGLDVIRIVSQSTPESKICLMSGFRDDCKADASALGALAFIGKPALLEDYMGVALKLARSRA